MRYLLLLLLIPTICLSQIVLNSGKINGGTLGLSTVGGGPTIVASDNFTRADSGTLGANWTATQGGGLQILNNTAAGQGTAAVFDSVWTANAFANNQYAKATVVRDAFGDYLGVTVRITGANTTENGYMFFVSVGQFADETHIYRIDNGVSTSLYTDSTHVSDGDVIEIRAAGSTIGAYIKGTLLYSVPDSTYSSGSAGLTAYSSGSTTFWEGGNL